MWWIGSNAAFQADYPDWKQVYDVPMILQEIYEANVDKWVPGRMIDQGKRNVSASWSTPSTTRRPPSRSSRRPRERRPLALTALAVHGVMTGVLDPAHNARLNSFDLVTPDGQPVRWALNLLHGAGLADRVYGPTLTLRVLRALRRRGPAGLPVRLDRRRRWRGWSRRWSGSFPALKIAGAEPSKFRAVAPGEDAEIADRIRASGARLVLVGLGCPRQEVFAYAMRAAAGHAAAGRRRGLRLPRRPAAQAAGRGCSGTGWSGCGGSAWSRGGSGGGT